MYQTLGSLVKFAFYSLIILLVATIVLTVYGLYLSNKYMNQYGENQGVYVFDIG